MWIYFLFFSSLSVVVVSFTAHHRQCGHVIHSLDRKLPLLLLARRDLEDEIERKSQENAQGGVGEVAAGVVLGTVLAGPFGALFGAQLGASLGARRAVDRARKEEMAKLGVTEEMLATAQECGAALKQGIESLELIRDSYETQKRFARQLDYRSTELYEMAKKAMVSLEEERARELLFDRNQVQEKLKKALVTCAEEKKRLGTMQSNVEALEQRVIEIESLLNRAVGAKTLQDSSSLLSLSDEDPLLQKFRDLGLD